MYLTLKVDEKLRNQTYDYCNTYYIEAVRDDKYV